MLTSVDFFGFLSGTLLGKFRHPEPDFDVHFPKFNRLSKVLLILLFMCLRAIIIEGSGFLTRKNVASQVTVSGSFLLKYMYTC